MKEIIRRYGILGVISLIINKIKTFFYFPNAKIIRFPIDIRGKRYIKVGRGFTTGLNCRIEAYPTKNELVLNIGNNFQMNDYVHITAIKNVTIGNNVLIASKVYISDCSHGEYSKLCERSSPDVAPILRPLVAKDVVIEDNVWIGEFVSILPGVTIGKGSIIGANSVVTKDIPENVIAVGTPAKPIKKFNFTTNKWEKLC